MCSKHYQADHYQANKELKARQQKEWRDNNPEVVKQREAERNNIRRQKIAAIKIEHGCIDCGYAQHPDALEFDHVRGEKLFNIGAHGHMSWEKVEAEMAKCEIVCANCHRIRTSTRRIELKGI